MEALQKLIQDYHIKLTKLSHKDLILKHQKDEELANQLYFTNYTRNFLKRRSLVLNKEIFNNSYAQLKAVNDTFKTLARQVKQIEHDYTQHNFYNVIFCGKAGTGKTLLATCLLNALNQHSDLKCLFIDVASFAELALSQNERTAYDEHAHLEQLMTDLDATDVLVLDDLGSESNFRDEVFQANNTIQRALFMLGTKMQHKSTVITTNLSARELTTIYNQKIISRLLTNQPEHVLKFNAIPDYRQAHN